MKKSKKSSRPAGNAALNCSAKALARSIANEILTVGASGRPVQCHRAVMMSGKYPYAERDMGGRNAASIAFVIEQHLLAAGYKPNT